MSTSTQNRTAYLRINHPTQAGVFEVVTIQQTLAATTTVPAYTFNWDPGDPIVQSISGLTWTTSFDFEWDGPQDLGPANFELTSVGSNDGGLTANLPQISYSGNGGTVTTTFTRNSAGPSNVNWGFTYQMALIKQVRFLVNKFKSLNLHLQVVVLDPVDQVDVTQRVLLY